MKPYHDITCITSCDGWPCACWCHLDDEPDDGGDE